MRDAAEKETAAEEARIKAAAMEDARKIVESAEQEITAAAKTARRELTAYRGQSCSVAGGQTDQGGRGYGSGAGAGICQRASGPKPARTETSVWLRSPAPTRAPWPTWYLINIWIRQNAGRSQSLAVLVAKASNFAKCGKRRRFRRNRSVHCWMRLWRGKDFTPGAEFFAVLMDHRRIKFLDPIVKEFEQELNRRLGFIEAQIVSARELGQSERTALEAQVER